MEILEPLNVGGRPSMYDPAFCDKADEYLQTCQDSYDEFHKTRGDKSDTYERQIVVKLPSHERFAQYLKVSREVIYKWAREYPDFKEALDRITAEQKSRLMENGTAGSYNSTITKLILSANHGMNEKTESEVTHRMPKPILDLDEDVPEDNSNQENPTPA